MRSCVRPRAAVLTAATVLSLAGLVAPTGTAYASTTQGSLVVASAELSPASCSIKYVSDAQPSRNPKSDVLVAAKISARTDCNAPVPWLTLQVTIIDRTSGEKYSTQATNANKNYVLNQDAFFPCPKTETHTYQGFAFGSTTEGGKNYFQYKEGRPQPLACSR